MIQEILMMASVQSFRAGFPEVGDLVNRAVDELAATEIGSEARAI